MISIKLSKDGTKLGVSGGYEERDRLKALGARWQEAHKLWVLPATPSTVAELVENYPDAEITEGCKPLLDAGLRIRASQAVKGHEDLPDVPVSNTEAWNHQRQAYHFVRSVWGLE